MEVLLVEKDPHVRDQVKVGLQQFQQFHVTCGDGYAAVNELRQRYFDCVFLGVNPRDKESLRLLQHLRSFDQTTELVVLTNARHVKDMSGDKTRFNINSFLRTPLDVKEFFSFVGRFLERRSERPASLRGKSRRGGQAARR